MFWGGAPILEQPDRDKAIAAGAELDELGYNQEENSAPENSDATGERSQTRTSPAKSKAVRARRRTTGGAPSIWKPITVDYDSDDARIIELKRQLYPDAYVANKLKEEGRIRYDAKAVGSRYHRFKKMLNRIEDERLDDELTDWHVGEDDELISIADVLEERYALARERLEKKKWDEVSLHLGEKMGRRKYTGKACYERFEGLKKGTALIPIELDEDQDGRRKIREERIAKAKEEREMETENARLAREAKNRRAEAKKIEAAELNQKRTAENLKRIADKTERERVKEERAEMRQKARRHKSAFLAQLRVQRDWEIKKRRAEKRLYRMLMGQSSGPKIRDNHESEEQDDDGGDEDGSDEEEARMIDEEDDDEDVIRANDVEEEDESEEPDDGDDGDVLEDEPTTVKSLVTRRRSRVKPTSKLVPKRTAALKNMKAQVTEETLLNPRSILNDAELKSLLRSRKLAPRTSGETHAEAIARIAAADDALKTRELSQLLMPLGESSKGKKVDKVRRLQEADANRSEAAQMGLRSTDFDFIQRYEGYTGEFSSLIGKAAAAREKRRGEGS